MPHFQVFDVDAARTVSEKHFRQWDKAIDEKKAAGEVRKIRYALWHEMLGVSPEIEPRLGGIYVFLNPKEFETKQIAYIGRSSPTRPLKRRITDYVKDDNAWDKSLQHLSDEAFKTRAEARLQTCYPKTYSRWAAKHQSLRERIARSSCIMTFPLPSDHEVIAQAKAALIASAAGVGWEILNQKLRKRKPNLNASAERLAIAVIEACGVCGLRPDAAKLWADAIE